MARLAKPLELLAIVADPQAAELLELVVQGAGEGLRREEDLDAGLLSLRVRPADLVFVDVALGRDAGLALVHHIRAVCPDASVYAIVTPEKLEAGAQATALGASGVLVLPLAGDEVREALSAVRVLRARDALAAEREAALQTQELLGALVSELTELGESGGGQGVAEGLARALSEPGRATSVVVYLGVGEEARQLKRVSSAGLSMDAPASAEELDLLRFAASRGKEVMRLALRRRPLGLALLGGVEDSLRSAMETIASVASLSVALALSRVESARGTIKDPRTSAYAFSYFVDVAGREIDLARRHGRRFSLATIAMREAPADPIRDPTDEVVERVLSAVRDTDVLARVDDRELYLLLPETGGLGAQACRRRLLKELLESTERPRCPVDLGLSIFPHDGTDLSRLLRAAGLRAEASRRSVVEALDLRNLPFVEQVDTLLSGTLTAPQPDPWLETPHYVELPQMDAVGLALSVVREGLRGGETHVIASQRSGTSLGGAVRAGYSRETDAVRLDVVDLSKVPDAGSIELLAVIAQHGAYALVGRVQRGLMRAVHATDPMLVDTLLARLGDATGMRFFEA